MVDEFEAEREKEFAWMLFLPLGSEVDGSYNELSALWTSLGLQRSAKSLTKASECAEKIINSNSTNQLEWLDAYHFSLAKIWQTKIETGLSGFANYDLGTGILRAFSDDFEQVHN